MEVNVDEINDPYLRELNLAEISNSVPQDQFPCTSAEADRRDRARIQMGDGADAMAGTNGQVGQVREGGNRHAGQVLNDEEGLENVDELIAFHRSSIVTKHRVGPVRLNILISL